MNIANLITRERLWYWARRAIGWLLIYVVLTLTFEILFFTVGPERILSEIRYFFEALAGFMDATIQIIDQIFTL